MGRPTEELRLPTRAVAVELLREGRDPERAELFVPEKIGASRSAIAAEVATLLENPSPFLPVREPDMEGRVALVGKHAILWVAVPLLADDDDDEPSGVHALYDHRHDVRVELDRIAPITGHVLYSSPADRPRLIDHLNLAVHFLRVWTTEALYLVNKHHAVRVLELT
jgi:hypothetical protein